MKKSYLFLLFSIFFLTPLISAEQHFVIVVASYNNKNYCEWNLKSIFEQNYVNYEVRYRDDCSSDGMSEMVPDIIKKFSQEHRTKYTCNEARVGALKNLYDEIMTCADDDVIVLVDGDDALADKDVLNYLNKVYSDPKIWLTYGQYRERNSGNIGFCSPMPADVVKKNAFRSWTHIPSHLRTFKAGLFKRIKFEDLLYAGEFCRMTWDMAMMLPMIEMASKGHFKFISKVLYIYNDANPISDHVKDKALQRKIDLYIRSLKPYFPL